jgi:putative membrane-bound dehydrogenase-like protein
MRRVLLVGGLIASLALALGTRSDGQGQKKGKGDDEERHKPENAVANLDVHKDLQATLFVSEPKITNPTNLDVDYRGRVWICDVKNYRGNNGKRPEGDRILILEDTDGDGKADKVKVFYQGRDVDSAMGICVLGNQVIVSCSPKVLVFTFDENDKILKKEALFTKTGQVQHDHSAHSFVFGPDGRLYWNFGNTGRAVYDKDGKPVIDLAGNRVVDNGKPYFGGMVFRCNRDGGEFEVLAHNFRNNYEVAVDSFGTLWQSDNDDDGNRGCRINYVMEFGNYGYLDEMTGAGWQTKRTNMETEIPLRHWHQNDPGVVPNLLPTYAGSPTGICVYEGTLLPKVFHNQMIHCDAGPNIVRSYPVVPSGAGYKVPQIINILDGSKKNNWFRPADVCVAPDGSLFVTDWYDPGVGGHGQRDLDRGRIFRVAPPGTKYTTPKFDFTTAEGATQALKNPNGAVRYLAWTALHQMQAKAEPALLKLWKSPVLHERARALWLLGQIKGKEKHYVATALADEQADLRVVALRLARLVKLDLPPLVRKCLKDPSPAVLRECAIALRHQKAPEAAELWAKLAARHDGVDRWYLEALGIGADRNWDAYLAAWLKMTGDKWNDRAGRDIIWRSRASQTPTYLAKLIADPKTAKGELPRLFRAFDFQQPGEVKNAALAQIAFPEHPADPDRQSFILRESLIRLPNVDVKAQPRFAAALAKLLDQARGTPLFIELVAKLNVSDRYPELLALAQKNPSEQLGVDAMRVLLDRDQAALIRSALEHKDLQLALSTAQALGSATHERANALLLALVQDGKRDLELRRQATRALAKTRTGAKQLIKLAQAKELAKELEPAAGSALATATWKDVKTQAAKLFKLPPGKDRPLPTIAELVKLRGNPTRGQGVFAKAGTCANCHVVNGVGKEVGPNLSEIGKKLSREALYESILFPSASISHNYETYVIETKKGNVESGILVSQTPEGVSIKGADALVRTFKKAEIHSMTRSPVSLMPADLHKDLTVQDLADVVEYLVTLREAKR